jgi:Small-conductance mechanosensitive channel
MLDKIGSLKVYLTDTQKLISLGNKALSVILIIAAVIVILHFGSIVINKFFEKQKKSRFGLNERKADTLSELLKSILKYTLYIVGALSILDQIGFETKTLLLGAGLGGVALGFGAQSLVKDVITGFFIIFEDQFSVGEYVTIDNMSGIVEAVGLRITRIKDFSGDLHIIPNGQIAKVTNHSRDNARAVVDVEIAYEANIDKALEVLNRISENLKRENSDIVEGPSVLGVSKLGDHGVSIRVIARTKPMKHWGVEMELRKQIKDTFDRESISIPYPTCVIITKNDNNQKG